MSTRNRTTSPAPFATLTSTTDHAAPLAAPMPTAAPLTHDAKADKARAAHAAKPATAKGKAKGKAAPKPTTQAPAPSPLNVRHLLPSQVSQRHVASVATRLP